MFTVHVAYEGSISVLEDGEFYAKVRTLEAAERIAQLLNESEGSN